MKVLLSLVFPAVWVLVVCSALAFGSDTSFSRSSVKQGNALPESGPVVADSAYALELRFSENDIKQYQKWLDMQPATHKADVRIAMGGKAVEMSFEEFQRRVMQ